MPKQECLLVKTGSEIALKSNFVRRFFTKKLAQSIKFALKRNKIPFSAVARGGGRLYLFCSNAKKSQRILSKIPGIHAIAIAEHFKPASLEELEKQTIAFSKKFLKKRDSFALDIRVAGRKEFSARQLERGLGAAIQKEIPGLKVNLSNPNKEIFIEVRKQDFFIYTGQSPGIGGLPLGVEGSIAFLFSGKKDELLAAFLLMRRGCNLFPVVKKKGKKLEKFLEKLIPFNAGRRFVPTEEKGFSQLIKERSIQAIGTADSKADKKAFSEYRKFDAKHQLLVLRPLLLYPKEEKKRLSALLH